MNKIEKVLSLIDETDNKQTCQGQITISDEKGIRNDDYEREEVVWSVL